MSVQSLEGRISGNTQEGFATPGETTGAVGRPWNAVKIVVVDDEPIVVRVIQLHLTRQGFTDVVTLTDATAALELIRRQMPAVVLLDISMPGIGGLEILSALRGDARTRHIAVIIITASSDPHIRAKAIELGARGLLGKPVDAVDLRWRIADALECQAP